jgi:CheY-like chemotaxis protein
VILPSSVTDTHAPRVLLIDDDPVVRDSIQALLEYLGYQCGAAADGPSGLRLFEGEPWDLLLTDLTLPGPSSLCRAPTI